MQKMYEDNERGRYRLIIKLQKTREHIGKITFSYQIMHKQFSYNGNSIKPAFKKVRNERHCCLNFTTVLEAVCVAVEL